MRRFRCNFCDNKFTQKHVLQTHIAERRCKSVLITDLNRINELIDEQRNEIDRLKHQTNISGDHKSYINQSGDHNTNNVGDHNNNINMRVEIHINSIDKLNVQYIDVSKMKELIEVYDESRHNLFAKRIEGQGKNSERINLAISDFIKNIICNDAHPENHSVKYIRKDPPTFNSLVEDSEGNTINVMKGLKDTCELLSDPILDKLKEKLKEFIKTYKKDDKPDFDYALYETAIRELKKELNKKTVKKALGSVLKMIYLIK